MSGIYSTTSGRVLWAHHGLIPVENFSCYDDDDDNKDGDNDAVSNKTLIMC